ncbi:amidase family protein [Sulfitobacter sp. PS-8MA]|uniref:amidase family protein n=1 Tax=Sulfitobacter sp. PS-8MA TaxID=3237707 RepID=UPI0034C6486A
MVFPAALPAGRGVAVAGGLCPAAIGSDTGGSVRIPASLTGLVGLKVTYGRISLDGCLSLSSTLDSLGPMTLCVEDARLLYHAMREGRLADHIHLRTAPRRRMHCRSDDARELFQSPVSPEIEAAYYSAQEALRAAGVSLVEN